LSATYKILSNILLSRLTPHAEEIIGIIIVDYDAKGQLVIIYSAFVRYLSEEIGVQWSSASAVCILQESL